MFFLFTGLALSLNSCVIDEDGYSEFVQNYIDSLVYLDTVSVDLDVPCSTPENMIIYYTYDDSFLRLIVMIQEVKVIRFGLLMRMMKFIYISLLNRPKPGKYVTDYFYGNPPDNDSEVILEYFTPSDDFLSINNDTIYVEKFQVGH